MTVVPSKKNLSWMLRKVLDSLSVIDQFNGWESH